MDVSIIIVNYNTLRLTKETIDSVFEKTRGINYEVILIDNNSSDGSKEFFINEYGKKIKFIKNNINSGFGSANNLGIKRSKGKYIFFLNSDTLLINNSVKILFDFLENNQEVGICGGNLYYEDLTPAHSFKKEFPSIKSEIKDLFFFHQILQKIIRKRQDFNYTSNPEEVAYITGANLMIKKNILDEVGGFDEDFFMYYEEVELTERVKKLGYKIMSVPKAKIIHLEGKSSKYKEKKFKIICESRYKFFDKIYGEERLKIFYFLFNCNLILRFILTFKSDYFNMLKMNNFTYCQHLKEKRY